MGFGTEFHRQGGEVSIFYSLNDLLGQTVQHEVSTEDFTDFLNCIFNLYYLCTFVYYSYELWYIWYLVAEILEHDNLSQSQQSKEHKQSDSLIVLQHTGVSLVFFP